MRCVPQNIYQKCRQHATRSEEHTSELQSRLHLVCRLLLEKKKNKMPMPNSSTKSANVVFLERVASVNRSNCTVTMTPNLNRPDAKIAHHIRHTLAARFNHS